MSRQKSAQPAKADALRVRLDAQTLAAVRQVAGAGAVSEWIRQAVIDRLDPATPQPAEPAQPALNLDHLVARLGDSTAAPLRRIDRQLAELEAAVQRAGERNAWLEQTVALMAQALGIDIEPPAARRPAAPRSIGAPVLGRQILG